MANFVTKIGSSCRLLAIALLFCATVPSYAWRQGAGDTADASNVFVFPNTQMNEPFVAPPNPNGAPSTQIWPFGFNMVTTSKAPFIQEDLRLGYQINYNLSFSINSRSGAEISRKLSDGWYSLSLAVLRQDPGNIAGSEQPNGPFDRFVTASDPMLVRISNGNLSKAISLRYNSVTATAMKNLLYLELTPLQENCGKQPCIRLLGNGLPDVAHSTQIIMPGLRPFLVKMRFLPYNGQVDGNPDPDSMLAMENPFEGRTLSTFVLEARRQQMLNRVRLNPRRLSPEEYAAQNRLHFIALDGLEFKTFGQKYMPNINAQAYLQSIIEKPSLAPIELPDNTQDYFSIFCNILMLRNRQYNADYMTRPRINFFPDNLIKQCKAEASKLFVITRNSHIGKLDARRSLKRLFNPSLTYTLMHNFSLGHTHSSSAQSAVTIKPLNPAMGPLEALGVALPFDWTMAAVESEDQAQGQWAISSLSETVDFNPLGLRIPVAEVRHCLEIRMISNKYRSFYDSTPKAKNGIYLCGREQAEGVVDEIYAHVFTRSRDSSIVDAYDQGTQSINHVLRGDRDLSALFFSLRKAMKPDLSADRFPFQWEDAARSYFDNTPSNNAHMISTPVFAKDWSNNWSLVSQYARAGVNGFHRYFGEAFHRNDWAK